MNRRSLIIGALAAGALAAVGIPQAEAVDYPVGDNLVTGVTFYWKKFSFEEGAVQEHEHIEFSDKVLPTVDEVRAYFNRHPGWDANHEYVIIHYRTPAGRNAYFYRYG